MRRDLLVSSYPGDGLPGTVPPGKRFSTTAVYQGNLSLHVYLFRQVALFNTSIQEFYDNNLALSRPEVRQGLFYGESTIYTKIHNDPDLLRPQRPDFKLPVADGCHLEGLGRAVGAVPEVKLSKYAVSRGYREGRTDWRGRSARLCDP